MQEVRSFLGPLNGPHMHLSIKSMHAIDFVVKKSIVLEHSNSIISIKLKMPKYVRQVPKMGVVNISFPINNLWALDRNG